MAKEPEANTVSNAYLRSLPTWEKITALMKGTKGMRAAGEDLLPRFESEEKTTYNNRLKRSTLTNFFKKTLIDLISKPFSEAVTINDDVPTPIKDLFSNVDLLGNNLDTFAREVFKEGIAKGLTHILVEFPIVEKGLNKEEEALLNPRPYFVHIRTENVITMHSEVRNGVEFLTHVRIFETLVEQDGFGEKIIEQIRILEPGTYELLRKNAKGAWISFEVGVTTLDFIPFVTYYTERVSLQESQPPLEDLADVNVQHWQSASDQRNVLTVARFPMLKVLGVPEDERKKIIIGPMRVLGSNDPETTIDYIETNGAAIEAGRKDLLDLQEVAMVLGAEMLVRKAVTATEKKLSSSERNSQLKSQTLKFTAFLNVSISIMGEWLDIEDTGTIALFTDFELSAADSEQLKILLQTRMAGEISRKTFLNEMQRRNVLSDDFDAEDDAEELETESIIPDTDDGGSNDGDDDEDNERV